MKLIIAPNVMLENPVKPYPLEDLHPAPVAIDMLEIMNKNSGLGLSANQVGFNGQIFVMKALLNKEYGSNTVVINPVVKGLSKEQELGIEGCLSHPDLFLRVTPDLKTVIHVETKFDDIDARIFLHEYDHLHGIQFINRVSKFKLDFAEKKRKKKLKRKVNGRTV